MTSKVIGYGKKSFLSKESDLAEYIFCLRSRHHQLLFMVV